MLRDILEIQQYAEVLCKSASVKTDKRFQAKFTDTPYPYTTDKDGVVSIFLPKLKKNMTEEELILHRHFVIHETLHHTEGPNVQDVWRRNKIPNDDGPLNSLCMAAEDYRIEHSGASKYAGDARSINAATGIMTDKFVDNITMMQPEERAAFEQNKYGCGMMAAMITDIEAREPWASEAVTRKLQELKRAMTPNIKAMYDKLQSIDYPTKLLNMKTEQDAIDVAQEAFKLLYDEDPEEHKQPQQPEPEKGDGDEGGESSDGKAKGTQESNEGADQGKGKEGEDDEQGDSGKPVEGFTEENKTVEYKKLLLTSHLEGGSGTGINITYNGLYANDDFLPTPLANIKVADYTRDNTPYTGHRTPLHIGGSTLTRSFANKVRRLVQVRSQARYIGGQTRGKINRKQLYRTGCPTVGNGEWNSKVFKRRHQDEILDTTIQLVIDSSGSMNGNKYKTAAQAAAMLNHAFEQTLHMPVEVLTFSESNGVLAIGVIKQAGKRITDEMMESNFQRFAHKFMGYNSDGEALLFAANRLQHARTKRKIMIVLSDGQPSSNRPGCEVAFTKGAINEIIRDKAIEVYAIGIMNDSVSKFYPEYQVIKEVSQLEPAILNVIKRKLCS